MKKSLLLITCGLLFSTVMYGQQIPLYTQYYINPFIFNPSFTGIDNKVNAYLIHRSQWSDMPGSPVTSALTLDAPILKNKIGVGLTAFNDVTGITTHLGSTLSLSYRLNFSESSSLAFGGSVGVLDNRIDFAKISAKDANEQTIINQSERKTSIDATLGAAYIWKKLQLGVAVPQVIGNSLEYVQIDDSRTFYDLARHYLVSAKYAFDVSKEKNITAYPLVLARKAPGAPLQYDINGVLDWKDKGWMGVIYKNDYAVSLNLGIRFKGLSLGYAYDMITGSIGEYSGASQEILLGYTFKNKDDESDEKIKEFNDKLDSLKNKLKEQEEQTAAQKQELDSLNAIAKEMDAANQAKFDSLNAALEKYKATPFTKADNMKMEDVKVGNLYRLPNVNFATNSADLNNKSLDVLNELADFLLANPTVKITLHGHTDDVGEEQSNQGLSERRALSVLNYLVGEGINKDRLTYKGFGETSPLIRDTNSRARARNRRTEFVITEK